MKNKFIRKKLLSEKKSDKKLIGYARAIDNEIDYLNKQIYDLNNSGCNSIFSEIISASAEKKPELQNAFNSLSPGDILIVDKLDRAFYSKNDCLNGLNILLQKGINLKILSSNFSSSERYEPFILLLKVLLELENLEKEISDEKKREMLKFDEYGKLVERAEYTDRWKYLSLIIYGENEPWSREYREWRYRPNEPITFTDQQTHFTIKDGVQISKIMFQILQLKLQHTY